jgi:hypothetical protein
MADPWKHALNLDRAVKQDGVAQARVTQEDYEGVKPLLLQVWRGERWEKLFIPVRSQEAELLPVRVLLGYLRGYFLYREIPENDHAFWPNFLADLGIEEQEHPKPAEYHRLWWALEQCEETRPILRFHKGGDRDFIGSLDAIFHFRALRLNALKGAFLEFYRTGELPEKAQPYERVLRRLREAMEFLLAEEGPPDLQSQEAVLVFLEGAGCYLGEPNPIRLLFKRSGQALQDLYWKLRGDGPSHRPKSPRFRHKQVKVELVDFPANLEEIRPTLSQEPLLEGWKVYGKLVLEDGRFRSFSWVPRFTPEGEPIPEELEVAFAEGEVVRFRLHHKAFALRFSEPVWRFAEPLELRPIGFAPLQHPLRFLLASGEETKPRPEELVPEMGEGLALEDELIVEVKIDGQDKWRRIATLPVELQVRLEGWVAPQGVFVRTHPPGLAVQARVFVEERLMKEVLWPTEPQGTLVAQAAWVPLRIEVRLLNEASSFVLMPREWPKECWRRGLGLGSNFLRGPTPED